MLNSPSPQPVTVRSKVILAVITAAALTLFLGALTSPVMAASKSNSDKAKKQTETADARITDLYGNVNVSQSELQTDLKREGYRRVELSWDSAGSEAATKYVIYTAKKYNGKYKKLAVTKSQSKVLYLKKKYACIKVRPYVGGTPGKLSSYVSVSPGYPNATNITLTKSKTKMYKGQTYTFKAKPNGKVSKRVTWKSSNSSIASVDSKGRVTAKANGSVNITTVAHNGLKKTTTVTIIDRYSTQVTPVGSTSVSLDDTKSVILSVTASEAFDTSVSWKSSNTSVAKVTAAGKVTAVSPGSAKISAVSKCGASAVFHVTVSPNTVSMVNWALKIADDSSYGYSMSTRYKGSCNGKTKYNRYCAICNPGDSKDYDCASFVGDAVAHGYGDPQFLEYCGSYKIGGCTDLYNKLIKAGWKKIKIRTTKDLKPGDILINPNRHVEIYIGDGKTVAAHDDHNGKSGEGSRDEIYVAKLWNFGYTVLRI